MKSARYSVGRFCPLGCSNIEPHPPASEEEEEEDEMADVAPLLGPTRLASFNRIRDAMIPLKGSDP